VPDGAAGQGNWPVWVPVPEPVFGSVVAVGQVLGRVSTTPDVDGSDARGRPVTPDVAGAAGAVGAAGADGAGGGAFGAAPAGGAEPIVSEPTATRASAPSRAVAPLVGLRLGPHVPFL
jgi:hypothetical protein